VVASLTASALVFVAASQIAPHMLRHLFWVYSESMVFRGAVSSYAHYPHRHLPAGHSPMPNNLETNTTTDTIKPLHLALNVGTFAHWQIDGLAAELPTLNCCNLPCDQAILLRGQKNARK
jgi:hypothetical protein